MHFLYLPLPPPFHNSEKTLHNSFACGYHMVRSSTILVFFLPVLIVEPYKLLLQYGCSALVLLTDWPGNSLHWHSGTYSTLRLEIPFPRSSILLFLLMILVQGISTNSSMNQNILDQVHLKTDTSTSHLTDWWLYTEFQA